MATQPEEIAYEEAPMWVRVVESCVITAIVPVIGFIFHTQDPLFYTSSFSWLVAPPLLVGLRYGFIFGLASGLSISLVMGLALRYGFETGHLPVQYAIGVVLVGMVAGEFNDMWRRRFSQMRIIDNYRATRLEEFVRNYHLLRVSHDQLSERLAANPHNLRDALTALSNRFEKSEPGEDILRYGAADLLRFIAIEGRVQQAALYAADEYKKVEPEALSYFGEPPSESDISQHPMVLACIEQCRMISIRNAMGQEDQSGQKTILAVVPLIDVHDRIWAVVTITEMPFVHFYRGNLHLLAVLGGNLGDVIREAYHRRPDDLDRARWQFETRVARWTQYAQRYDLMSLLMAYEIPSGLKGVSNETVIDLVFEQLRTLDSGWVVDIGDGTQILYVLMPLTPERGATAYRERMTRLLQERFGLVADESGIVFHQRVVDGKRSASALLASIRMQVEGDGYD